MRISKFIKKYASFIMAVALLLCTTMTAMATNTNPPETITIMSEKKVQKVWTVADAAMFDETESFTLELSYLGKTNLGTNVAADPTGITQSVSKKITIGGTGKWIVNADDSKIHTSYVTYSELFAGITFMTPGIYHFTVNEKAGTNPNIQYSGQTYYADVQVGWQVDANGKLTGALHVDGIAVYNGQQKSRSDKVDMITFDNSAAENSSLTVFKTVTGNASNKNDLFEFTITVSGVKGTYPASNATGKVTAVNGFITEKVSLKHGEKFVIYNLPTGANYAIAEMDTAYSESFRINNGETKDGLATTGKIGKEDTTVEFVNTKNIATPTGVFMDVMPYALILVAAVLGCVVLFAFRRRRHF